METNSSNALFFVPDISGFKKFINDTAIKHSQEIICKLLDKLIDSNQMSLNIAEIEGDAVFFYRFGLEPTLNELSEQSKKMFIGFHSVLKSHELYSKCECDACKSAKDLKLKIIVHYGQAQKYTIKSYTKLIGKDVIIAHLLLKNNIPLDQYILITDNLKVALNSEIKNNWLNFQYGEDTYDELGKVYYKYSTLYPLLTEVINDK